MPLFRMVLIVDSWMDCVGRTSLWFGGVVMDDEDEDGAAMQRRGVTSAATVGWWYTTSTPTEKAKSHGSAISLLCSVAVADDDTPNSPLAHPQHFRLVQATAASPNDS